MKPVSSRKTHPKCKVQSLLKHAIMVSKDAIAMGEGFVVVEDTIGCKGIQTDILRITYKKHCVQMATCSALSSATSRIQSVSLIN